MTALTPEEWQRCQSCLDMLEDELVLECKEEAELIAMRHAHAARAYSDLLPLLVKLRVAEIETDLQRRSGN